MIPASEDIEALHDRVKGLDAALGKLKGAEVTRPELIQGLANAAKEWLRLAPALKSGAEGFLPSLDAYERAMSEVLVATKSRTRATVYQKKLMPFLDGFVEAIVVPVMRYEGSPGQVASRQIENALKDVVNTEELTYVQEAARCSSVHCQRAAIVLLWAAAMARFHTSIQTRGFASFNAAASAASAKKGNPYSRIAKNLNIQSLPELQKTRDFDIIAVGLDLWSYDMQAYEELERLLGTRNSAAHPGMFQPGALDVRQFAEKLRRYVFELVK